MNTLDRLLGWQHALDHPVSFGLVAAAGCLLLFAPLAILLVTRVRHTDLELRTELWQRWRSWLVLVPLICLPILAGGAWTILGVTVLSIFCYAEFARATGLFRDRTLSTVVVVGIVAQNFAALDHWYALYAALFPLTVGLIVVVAILKDNPKGYIQRVALAILGFALFGVGFSHLSFFANDANYRPILLMLFFCVELNDVFAFTVGKTIGKHKLAPNTSPGKTIEGSVGALVLTTTLTAIIAHFVFIGTPLDSWPLLLLIGVAVSALGQLGDLTLSSIKRDIGIKDMGAIIPGHGGVLDRFNSMLLVAPAVFHLAHYILPGIGHGQAIRIITGA